METSVKMQAYQSRKADSSKIWILFLFFGWSYGSLGQMGKQILFYLTLGGLGIWTLFRLFTLGKAIKNYNYKIAVDCGLNSDEIRMLGVL